jgi:hypothetical protein
VQLSGGFSSGHRWGILGGHQGLKRLNECSHLATPEQWLQQGREIKDIKTSPGIKDPTTDNMVHLFWFFHHECNLSRDESEKRTALIRNAFWTKVKGIHKVMIFRGCDAVRKAVERF